MTARFHNISIHTDHFAFLLLRRKSTYTASRITAPLIMYCQSEFTPIRFRPLVRIPMISAPINVPPRRPEPPDMEVPPTTTDAMASISAPSPDVQVPEYRRDAIVTPETLPRYHCRRPRRSVAQGGCGSKTAPK